MERTKEKINEPGAGAPERRTQMTEKRTISAANVAKLAAAPFVGLAFAVFLPFIGIIAIPAVAMMKLAGVSLEEGTKATAFRWAPGAAYLTGKKKEKKEE